MTRVVPASNFMTCGKFSYRSWLVWLVVTIINIIYQCGRYHTFTTNHKHSTRHVSLDFSPKYIYCALFAMTAAQCGEYSFCTAFNLSHVLPLNFTKFTACIRAWVCVVKLLHFSYTKYMRNVFIAGDHRYVHRSDSNRFDYS